MSYHSAVFILFYFYPYCFYGGNVAGPCSVRSVEWGIKYDRWSG